MAVFQTVRVHVRGQPAVLMIIGVNLDTHDDRKAEQIDLLLREIHRQHQAASREGQFFQAILLGDINDRLVLKLDAKFDVDVAHVRHWGHTRKVASLTNRSQAILRHLLVTAYGRKELLSWDVKYFDGLSIGGVSVSHPSRKFCDSFFLQTDWWREQQLQPAPVTYKYTPWDQLVSAEVVDEVARESGTLTTSHEWPAGLAVTFMELEQALKRKNQSAKSLDPNSMPSFFMMSDHIPKTKLQVEDAQIYLNVNMKREPVYLAFGWLDSIGFLRPMSVGNLGFDMPTFLDFTTDFGVRGGDHAFTHARIKLTVNGLDAQGGGIAWWLGILGAGTAMVLMLVAYGICRRFKRCPRHFNTD